jgi:hypothetical protein
MFKVKDLMIDVLGANRGGAVAQPAPTDPTPPTPISPVAVTATLEHKFLALDKAVEAGVDVKFLEDAAFDFGRPLVAARIAAYCAQDMATCGNNPRLSPYADLGLAVLRDADFGVLHDQVIALSKWVDERGDLLEKRAFEHKEDLARRLEAAAAALRSR